MLPLALKVALSEENSSVLVHFKIRPRGGGGSGVRTSRPRYWPVTRPGFPRVLLLRLSAQQRLCARRSRVARVTRLYPVLLKARFEGGLHSGGVRMQDSPGACGAQRRTRCVHVPC